MRLLLSHIFLLVVSISMFGQATGSLTGRVLDLDGLPLAGAEVWIEDTDIFTTTTNNGFFVIQKLPLGSYNLKVEYFGYKETSQPIEIIDNQPTEVEVILEEGVVLDGIVVQGSLNGIAKALNQQKNSINVVNVISSDQVDKFPDDNLGDALNRVAGINVQFDQGEPRFGNIRGTSPDMSSVTMDGNRLPSAEGEVRAFQLDLIPADMVQAIEVNKVVTPDMDGDAIGASVNLVTRSVPNGRRVRVDLRGGYNTISEKANYKGAILYADRIADNKLGFTVLASVFNNYIDSDNFEMEWDEVGPNGEIAVEDFQIRDYSLQRLRQNYSLALDYKFNQNHRIEVKGGYNQRDDYENRYRLRYKGIEWDDAENTYTGEVLRETKGGVKKDARLEKQKLINFNINGEHLFQFMKMDWGASLAKANEERPEERYIAMSSGDAVTLNSNFSDPRNATIYPIDATAADITNFELDELTEENKWTEEEDKTMYANFDFPISNGRFANSLKVGAKFKYKEKERDNTFTEYSPIDTYEDEFLNSTLNNIKDMTDPDFQASDVPIGAFVSEGYLGNINFDSPNFEGERDVEELAGNYTANENIMAGYIRFDQHIGKEWMFVGGLRVEKTDVSYNGFIANLDDETITATGEQSKDYTNLMPSLLVKYSPAVNWNIKLGVTSTIARPRYFDLVPYQIINYEDNELVVGNPDLEATKSLNLDLMGEKYFKGIGLVEAGIFYKDITGFIVEETYDDYEFNGQVWNEFSRPVNVGDADLFGVELGFQRPLDFISPSLKDFSFYTNYTFTSTNVTNFKIDGREDEDIEMSGTPAHTLNASLAYSTNVIETRLSYNYASDFIDEYSDEAFKDRYYDSVDYLDFNFNYNISERFSAYLKVNNILNQPLRYYQGQEDRTMQEEYYGVKYKLGVQFNL